MVGNHQAPAGNNLVFCQPNPLVHGGIYPPAFIFRSKQIADQIANYDSIPKSYFLANIICQALVQFFPAPSSLPSGLKPLHLDASK